MLNGLCCSEKWDDAEELLARMVHKNCPPDQVAFNTIITSLCHKGLVNRAIKVFDRMSEHGSIPNIVTCNCIIDVLCNKMRVEDAMKLLSAILYVQA